MKKSSFTSFLSVAGVASLAMLSAFHASAQTTVATDPVGYTTTALLANSDTLVSIPFTRPAAYTGAIASISGSTITLSGTPGFTASQFVYNTTSGTQSNTYYAIIGPLLTSLTNTVGVTNGGTTVTGSGFTASGIAAGDEIIISGLAYNVASVTDTVLTLSRAYTGATANGLSASFDHSPKEGSYYTVTANDTGSFTVNLNGDSLSTVAVGTSVSLIPYWTLGTAFPASDAGVSYTASTSTGSKGRGTQILLPDNTSAGINLSSKLVYYSYNGLWEQAGQDLSPTYNDTILPPSTYLTVRNVASPTTFTASGGVYMNRLNVPISTQAGVAQDNAVALDRPANVSLNDSGLISSGAFTPSVDTSSKHRADVLFTYNNATASYNKSAANIYYYSGGVWYSVNDPGVDHGTDVLSYGTGITIRKAATTNGITSFWQNTRNY